MTFSKMSSVEICVVLERAIHEAKLTYDSSVIDFHLSVDYALDGIIMGVRHLLLSKHELRDDRYCKEKIYDRVCQILQVKEKPVRYVRIERQRMLSRAKRAIAAKPKRI